MKLPDPIAIAIINAADWLDDRLTIAAIGMMTGYFGLTDVQWDSLGGVVIAIATALLVLIPDPRKRRFTNEIPPMDLIGRAGILDADRDVAVRRAADERVQQPVQSRHETESIQPDNGWNG